MKLRLALGSLGSLAFWIAGVAIAKEKLVINSMHSDPLAKQGFESAVASFRKANPDVDVRINNTAHEAYKIQIRTWLPNNPPDVATWFAGNRAKYFIDRSLVEPIDDVWAGLEAAYPDSVKDLITVNGKRYLLPVSYYHWGFYYRKDLVAAAGGQPPTTWAELKALAAKLKAKGIVPITIGTKNSWPAAAWFDFVDMRVNGYAFHKSLLLGQEKYTDSRVKKTMATWRELIDLGAFTASATAMTWQEAAALMWRGKAAMYLMGNFVSGEIPSSLKDQVGFFPFPVIDPQVADAEVAPTDVYFIPAKAKNKAVAKRFLAHLGSAETQGAINAISHLLPTNRDAKFDEKDPFLVAGLKLLQNTKGITQFYDRDADPQVAEVGMNAFVEFMHAPQDVDRILAKIEKARARVHGP